MLALEVLGSLGGVVALLTAVTLVARGIFRQVSATEDNTTATRENTKAVNDLKAMFANHETRITVLEDRNRRNVHGNTP